MNELIRKGLVKAESFKHNPNKRSYLYLLTPRGVKEKSVVTMRFLEFKMKEYEQIKKEIERLKCEINEEPIVNENLYRDVNLGER